jgi:hypothetical protein
MSLLSRHQPFPSCTCSGRSLDRPVRPTITPTLHSDKSLCHHSERSPRSEDLRPIARCLRDESLFAFRRSGPGALSGFSRLPISAIWSLVSRSGTSLHTSLSGSSSPRPLRSSLHALCVKILSFFMVAGRWSPVTVNSRQNLSQSQNAPTSPSQPPLHP